jgi:anaerobic dimethyl sulfoxide reductase subunit B (iron-sulfur subunit)
MRQAGGSQSSWVRQYAFYFDSSACSGCKACQAACKDKHDLPVNILWRRVYEIAGGNWTKSGNVWVPGVFSYYVSMACHQCAKPICGDGCPTKAIYKRQDGIVLLDTEACIGCRLCEWACPYGALQFDEATRLMTKCHFCFDYIDLGKPPACVAACPMRALDFGELADLRKKYGGVSQVFPLPEAALTEPALVIKPHRDATRATKDTAEVANWEEI